MKKVCLIIGAGAGIGGNCAKVFSKNGYFSFLTRRTDQIGLNKLVKNIQEENGEAAGELLNIVDEKKLEDLVENIEKNIGSIEVAIYNLGSQIGNRSLAETKYKTFELGWKMATFGLFRLAKTLFPFMLEREKGTLIVTSSTAAVRGNRGQHSHSASMAGRRMLCQSLNDEFSKKGIHIIHSLIDGAVDAPDTLGKMLGKDKFNKLRSEKGLDKDGLILPKKIAECYYYLSQQHRSTWTNEIDLRSFSDQPWWNTSGDQYNF
ncbi:MAG: Fatty acyl-CoA reductase [Alphaproteobacteria bacterium MarineAlpha9_Bin4]|nr:short-chain dehydrogenase [Pelagibacterales bacterium]PPR25874.1 MAG: Fatty acyl-CoA reductase [Alphaproteobacteria bacterium MarineAlpha9_Bin4]|tara:strand:- start:143 stop:928 length:786 start_codon:yes stop_codon:yes gene_type:complete